MVDWQFVIDAYTGGVLEKRDLILEVDGHGKVFYPNPVVTANDNTYRDPDATPDCGFAGTPLSTLDMQQVDCDLKEITLSGGVYKLVGPYVKMLNLGPPRYSAT